MPIAKPHRRLFGYCSTLNREGTDIVVRGQPNRLLRNLILFDHFTLRTFRFLELPDFVIAFGLEGTIAMLKSGLITTSPDFALFATDISVNKERVAPYTLSIGRVNSVRKYSLDQNLQTVSELMPSGISTKDRDKMLEAVLATLPDEPPPYGQKAEEQANSDCVVMPDLLKTAVAYRLRQLHGFAINAKDFMLSMHKEGQQFRAETNLASLCRLTDKEVHDSISMSLVAVAHLNLRIEEMQMYQSISGFQPEELELFDTRTKYLIEQNNAEILDGQFRRLISILDRPDILGKGRFDVDAFLKVRVSPECAEFRNRLSTTDGLSDEEVKAHVKSVREAFSRHYQGLVGKTVRLLVSTGFGLLPGIGSAAGLVAGALDTFLLDRIIWPTGPISFISSSYPSLFDQ